MRNGEKQLLLKGDLAHSELSGVRQVSNASKLSNKCFSLIPENGEA